MTLMTLAAWRRLSPMGQGYVLYMEEEHPGSELKGQECPYAPGSSEYLAFQEGQRRAVLAAQDSEE
jgi:hypothetical protein